MPHIIVEYSRNLTPGIDMGQVVAELHDTLAARGVDKARIKSRAIALPHSVVGANAPDEGHMAHVTLLLLEGRDIPTKKIYGQALHDVLVKKIRAKFPQAAVTLEVRDMVKDTYFL